MEAKSILPKKIRLTSTIRDHFVSSLSHCKCAIKVTVETNSRIPYIRAKYHDINPILCGVVYYTSEPDV